MLKENDLASEFNTNKYLSLFKNDELLISIIKIYSDCLDLLTRTISSLFHAKYKGFGYCREED